jgi:ATP-binding cassette subfamily F protein uup
MKNPNFLILDEPTNDLDILTLNVLEEYLQNFRGCVIIVSHDRYFMDKVVDHLFIFKGDGIVKDFPGNYSIYRDFKSKNDKLQKPRSKNSAPEKAAKPAETLSSKPKKKLTYKEQKEYEQLEPEIEKLEAEYKALEASLYSGTLSGQEVVDASNRLGELMNMIDAKTNRWLQLTELKESME